MWAIISKLKSSLQLKISLIYILVIAGVLALLNTYPVLVSEDLVFKNKAAALQNDVYSMSALLSGMEQLTPENVAQALSGTEQAGLSRVLVTDAAGEVLYDTRESGGAVGSYALMTEIVQALRGNDVVHSGFESGAFRTRAASPVLFRNQIIGAVFVYEYDTEQAALLQSFQANLRRVSIGVAATVLLLSLLLSRKLTCRISELLTAIRRVREGAYSHRAEVGGGDEIAQLATEFNAMTDQLQQTEVMRRRFVSDASHELKTPLAAIRLLTDSILQTETMDSDTAREFMTDIGAEAGRLNRITEDLLRLTRLDSDIVPEAEVVDMAELLRRVLRMMDFLALEKNIDLSYTVSGEALVLASNDEVQEILCNLLDNAIKYSRQDGFVQIDLTAEENEVVLTVTDNGIGIPEEDISHIFERFYRVDKARSRAAGGTGLGLSIVHDIVCRRGGGITAAHREGGGTVFTVHLPRAKGGAEG